jgi:hypothetical protein
MVFDSFAVGRQNDLPKGEDVALLYLIEVHRE